MTLSTQMIAPVVFAVTLLLMAGCAAMPKRPQLVTPHASIPVPENWSGAAPDKRDSSKAVEGEWWHSFAEPALDALIDAAMQESYSLEATSARIESALVQANLASASFWPQTEIGLSRNRQRQNFVGLPFPGAEGRVLSNTFTVANLGINIGWELDLWGRIKAGRLAASADAEAAYEDLRAARQSLAAQIARQWFLAAAINQQLSLSNRTIANYQQVLDTVRFRYERGLRPPLDVRLTLTDLASAETRLKEQTAQRDVAIRLLQTLAGSYPDASLPAPAALPMLPAAPPAGLPADIVARRPDLVAAERRLAAAGARVTEARATRYPAFSLTSSGGYGSNQLTDIVKGNFLNYNLITGVTAPLFDGQRLSNQAKLREAQVAEGTAGFQQTLLTAYREVETALAAERLLAEQEASVQQNVREAVAARDLSEQQYRSGLADVLAVLTAERAALAAEASLIEIQRQRLTNRVDLYLALGGGFERSPAEAGSGDIPPVAHSSHAADRPLPPDSATNRSWE